LKKLAIISTHPIQYNAPLFALLAQRNVIEIKVFYTWGETVLQNKYDPGFGKVINWDIPLLEGYAYSFVHNVATNKGSQHFKGIDNPSLIADIEKWGAGAILIFGWSFKSHLKTIRYFHNKIPVYFRGDSTLMRKQSGLKIILRKIFLKWVYHYIDAAFYVGTENKKYFLANGLKTAQLIFAAHAVNNELFADADGTKEIAALLWKKELGIKEGELTIIFAGKLEAVKNPFFILELARRMAGLSIQFVMAGNGPLEVDLKAQASDLPNMIFLDFQNQSKMPLVYRLGDVYILPSESETWGLAVNEAMACGKAVVVSKNVACATDLVKQGINGYAFDGDNIEDVVEYLKGLIKNPSQVSKMGAASLGIITSWSYEHICIALENEITKTVTV